MLRYVMLRYVMPGYVAMLCCHVTCYVAMLLVMLPCYLRLLGTALCRALGVATAAGNFLSQNFQKMAFRQVNKSKIPFSNLRFMFLIFKVLLMACIFTQYGAFLFFLVFFCNHTPPGLGLVSIEYWGC
jgi:hypothetical protein